MNAQLFDVLHDPARIAELVRLRLLDTPPEAPFDRLTRLAVRVLGAPVALVSLVDTRRQFFKSACGLPEPWASRRETPLTHSFCQYVVASGVPLAVEDAREHPLVRDNLAVTDLNVIAYLGIPLSSPKGAVVGSFCVLDTQPRTWTPADQQTMAELAASVMSEFALRLANDDMHAANGELQSEAARREGLMRELEHSEARLRAAQRLARVGSFVLHRNETAVDTHWSDEACRIFAIEDAGPLSSVAGFAHGLVHPDDRSRVAVEIERAMDQRLPREIEHRVCSGDGRVRSVLTAIEPETTGEAADTVLCTTLDITERNRIETELAEYRNELWHVARVATAGEMATMLAHEVNQPLAAIAHTAHACSRLHADGKSGDAEFSEHLADIYAQAKRASEIVRRIRTYVRKQPLVRQPLDLDRVVDDILRMMAPQTRKLGVGIDRFGPGGLPGVVGDEIQLGQLVLNLVRNALDAVAGNTGPDRRVVITTSCPDPHHIALEVGDSGPGIGADLRARIFDPFFTTRPKGLGMGLPIARTIAETHKAVLSVLEPAAGEHGARFRVVFPVIAKAAGEGHGEDRLSDR